MAARRRVSKLDKLNLEVLVAIAERQRAIRDIETGLKVRLYQRLVVIEKAALAIPDRILKEHWAGITEDLKE